MELPQLIVNTMEMGSVTVPTKTVSFTDFASVMNLKDCSQWDGNNDKCTQTKCVLDTGETRACLYTTDRRCICHPGTSSGGTTTSNKCSQWTGKKETCLKQWCAVNGREQQCLYNDKTRECSCRGSTTGDLSSGTSSGTTEGTNRECSTLKALLTLL